MTSFTLIVQKKEHSDELFLQFPDGLMRELDWRESDTLFWGIHGEDDNFSVSLKNTSLEARQAPPVAETKLYEVQVLVSHRVRYAVKATSAEQAAAAVLKGDCDAAEFDQNCLGVQVVCNREVSMEQYLSDSGHVGTNESKRALIHDASQKETAVHSVDEN